MSQLAFSMVWKGRLLGALAGAAVVGCSGGGAPKDGGGDAGAGASGGTTAGPAGPSGTGGSSAQSGAGGAEQQCPNGTEPCPLDALEQVGHVTATILDTDGKPMGPDVRALVCSCNLCINSKTDASGSIDVTVPAENKMSKPTLSYGDGQLYVKMSPLQPTLPDHDWGTVHTVRLPDYADGVAMKAGESVSQAGVTLAIAPGAVIEHDAILYADESEQVFRVARFPAPLTDEHRFPAIDASPGVELVVGLAPLYTQICPAAKMTVDNALGWPAASAVEFYLHGVLNAPGSAPYGGWKKLSDGSVSADGKTVSTADGAGIGELGVIGIKRKM
jgi:hypothetical protein